MSNMSRNEEHILAMNIIYSALVMEDGKIEYDPMELISSISGVEYDECSIYVRRVVISSLLHKNEIIEAYIPYLKNWKFHRLSFLMQAILLLSYSHFFYTDEKTDRKIIIDVAVNLAKSYLDSDKDYKFVNAILENVIK